MTDTASPAAMTKAEYKAACRAIGTQAEVAALLGLNRETISRRCSEKHERFPITLEASVAIRALEASARSTDDDA